MKRFWISIALTLLAMLTGRGNLALADAPLIAQGSRNDGLSLRFSQALSAYRKGDFEKAIAQWNRLLQDPEIKRDRLRLGRAWNYLSLAQQKQSQWDAAKLSIRKSLGYLSPRSNGRISELQQRYYAQALNTQGQLHLELGADEKAVDTWEQSEALYRTLNDKIGVRGSLLNQALALEKGGFYRRACFTILEAVDVKSQCNFSDKAAISQLISALTRQGDLKFQAIALHSFSKILLQLGDLDLAETVLDHAQLIAQSIPNMQQSLRLTEASFAVSKYQTIKQEESRARTQRIAQGLQTQLVQQAAQVQDLYRSLQQLESTILQYQVQVDYLAFLVDHLFWLQDNQLNSTAIETEIQGKISQLNRTTPASSSQQAVQFSQIKHANSFIQLLAKEPSQYRGVTGNITDLLQPILTNTSQSQPQTRAFAYGTLGRFYEIQQQWPQAQQATQLAISNGQSIQNVEMSYRWQWQLGRIFSAQGQRDRAIQSYEQALLALQTIRKDLLSLKRDAQLSFRDQIEPSYREFVALLLNDPNPNVQTLSQARRVIDRLQVSEVEDFLLQNCITASLASLDSYIETQSPSSALIYTIVQDEHLDIIVKIPGLDQIKFHRVSQSKAELNRFLRDYRRSLQTKLPSAKRQSQQQGQQLYQWLVAPFQAAFQQQKIDTLVFVLDGGLRDIPMATLYTGQDYVIKDYAIAVTPGLQVLEARGQASETPEALVAGASEGDRNLGLPALPAVKREIQQIQSTLSQTEVLLDDAFTTTTFQSSLQASTASIIHIATHGQFSSNPEETFIVTGTGERLDIDELGSLLRQRTRANSLELLFLSACQTLAGDRWAALGMAGVAIRSGAQSTIASIWNADDEASAELVSRFYTKLTETEGRSKAKALQLAQLEMLENPRYTLPVYWSPYVLIGNWQ